MIYIIKIKVILCNTYKSIMNFVNLYIINVYRYAYKYTYAYNLIYINKHIISTN